MKKMIALLLCCLLLAGSLTGLAGGAVQPCRSCGCEGPFQTEYLEKSAGCWTLQEKKEICAHCGDETLTLLSRADDNHSAKAKRDPLRGWIVVCSRCRKELTYTLPATEYWSADRGWVILQDR